MTSILPNECPNCGQVRNLYKWWGSHEKWCNPCVTEATISYDQWLKKTRDNADQEAQCYERPRAGQSAKREEYQS